MNAHTHEHTNIHKYTCKHPQYTHMNPHGRVHTNAVHMFIQKHTHTQTHVCIHAYTCEHMHAHMYTHVKIHAHTHEKVHTNHYAYT